MSRLHTINAASVAGLCLRMIEPGDAVLLIEDGVYLAAGSATLPRDLTCFALAEDVDARGLKSRVREGVECISMARFVSLCGEYDKVVNWF